MTPLRGLATAPGRLSEPTRHCLASLTLSVKSRSRPPSHAFGGSSAGWPDMTPLRGLATAPSRLSEPTRHCLASLTLSVKSRLRPGPEPPPSRLDLSSSRARSLALGHAATPFDVRKPGPSVPRLLRADRVDQRLQRSPIEKIGLRRKPLRSASNPLVTAIPLSSNSCFAGNSELREVSQGGRGRA